METSTAQLLASETLTPQEREDAIQYLNETRDGLVEIVKGLSPAQLAFKPSAECWSVAENAEHIALIANLVASKVVKDLTEGAPAAAADRQSKDTHIRTVVPTRQVKVKGPAFAMPTGQVTLQESLDRLGAAHASLIGLVETRDDLRCHFAPHPTLGLLDGYQWAVVTAAHTQRHTGQISEVTSDPHFPAA